PYSGVNASDFETSFATVLAPLLFLRMSSLGLCQLFLILGKALGVADGLPSGEDHQGHEAQIEPYLLVHCWQVLDIFFYQNGDEIAVSCVFGNGDARWFDTCGQGARPVDIEGSIHLSKEIG